MKFKVAPHEKGERLLSFLRTYLAKDGLSVKALKRSIDQKRCKVNGRVETFSTHPLAAGDTVEIVIFQEEAKRLLPLLLWEDEVLTAYDKPAGVVSEQKKFPGQLVHRLDKETSGVLLVAKNSPILEKMIGLFKNRQVRKEYLAIVDGLVYEKEKTIISKLAPRHRFQGQVIYASNSFGKKAITYWELQGRGEKTSLLLCKPVTGRTHQLRVHLKEAGHPILGDYHYAKTFHSPLEVRRHMLHALRIAFPHPLTGENVEITAPPPPDFIATLNQVGFHELLNY